MKNGWKQWTEKEYVLLISLIQRGLKPTEIAAQMQGRSKSAVMNKIYGNDEVLSAYRQNRGGRRRPRIACPEPTVKPPPVKPKPATQEPAKKPSNSTSLLVALSIGSLLFSFATFLIVILALMS